MVLGDHVEVLRQCTGGDEARPLLYENNMPRAVEVRSQQARIRTTCGSTVPRGDEERGQETGGATDPKTRSRLTVIVKVRNESGRACLRSMVAGWRHASHQSPSSSR